MFETAAVHLSASARLVAETLASGEQSTVRALADAARVSKSTVAKALAVLEHAGAAIRTVREDGGVRDADLWAPGPALDGLLFTRASGASGYGHAETSVTATETAVALHVADVSADGDEAEALGGCPTAALPPGHAASECSTSSSSPEPGAGVVNSEGPMYVPETESPDDSVAATVAVRTAPSELGEPLPGERARRLAAGELAAMVAAVLTAHPDIEYTPTMLSHMLDDRSSGAIHNVLEKMIKAGTAVRTCDRPKRYRCAAPAASSGS